MSPCRLCCSTSGSATERPSTTGAIQRELRDLLGRDEPWSWVAETAGEVVGLAVVSPPERAEWIAKLTSAAPVAYLSCLVVTAGRRPVRTGPRAR